MIAKRLLEVPGGFDLWQRIVGAPESKRRFVSEHVRARSSDRVLDLGCGTGALLEHLPATVAYVGVDLDPGYVKSARQRHGDRGEFVCADISEYEPTREFDLVIAYGVLHHLDDLQLERTLAIARAALATGGGRAVFAEPCRTTGQGRVERFLIDNDRGRYVRPVDDYVAAARKQFAEVAADIVTGTYRVPYSMVMLEGRT
jgi:SAM-dependent methyltransferase